MHGDRGQQHAIGAPPGMDTGRGYWNVDPDVALSMTSDAIHGFDVLDPSDFIQDRMLGKRDLRPT